MTQVAEKTELVYTLFIRATPEQVWDAITQPQFTTQYFYGSAIDSTFVPGSPYVCRAGEMTFAEGEILESDPPHLLQHSWRTLWVPEASAEDPSRVSWTIETQEDETTRLTLIHGRLEHSPHTLESVEGGWSFILGGLKTLLETEKPLT